MASRSPARPPSNSGSTDKGAAARELIRAGDAFRALERSGKATSADVDRVARATEAYDQAGK